MPRFAMFSIWFRALSYMVILGVGWLVALPASLLWIERGHVAPEFRAWPFVAPAIALFVFGFALAVWAGFYLIRHGRGTPLPFDPPRHLVTAGPYRFVRNPQGIAMTLMAAAEVLAIASQLIWLLLPLTLAYLELLVGPLEERQLARNFGPEYAAYKARVGKWIPLTRCRRTATSN